MEMLLNIKIVITLIIIRVLLIVIMIVTVILIIIFLLEMKKSLEIAPKKEKRKILYFEIYFLLFIIYWNF
jgi:hypothetical protein